MRERVHASPSADHFAIVQVIGRPWRRRLRPCQHRPSGPEGTLDASKSHRSRRRQKCLFHVSSSVADAVVARPGRRFPLSGNTDP